MPDFIAAVIAFNIAGLLIILGLLTYFVKKNKTLHVEPIKDAIQLPVENTDLPEGNYEVVNLNDNTSIYHYSKAQKLSRVEMRNGVKGDYNELSSSMSSAQYKIERIPFLKKPKKDLGRVLDLLYRSGNPLNLTVNNYRRLKIVVAGFSGFLAIAYASLDYNVSLLFILIALCVNPLMDHDQENSAAKRSRKWKELNKYTPQLTALLQDNSVPDSLMILADKIDNKEISRGFSDIAENWNDDHIAEIIQKKYPFEAPLQLCYILIANKKENYFAEISNLSKKELAA